uniref:Uncharacterized protein n=1 Tax=Globodera rostochiensis TaxID=31243 RepID=A0A914H6K5_GLORO
MGWKKKENLWGGGDEQIARRVWTGCNVQGCATSFAGWPFRIKEFANMSKFLLFVFVCQLTFCSCAHFGWWHEKPSRRAQIEKVIDNCCPRDETNTAHFCCAAYLFDTNPDKHWKQCQEEGIAMATILRTVQCAQREFVVEGHAASTDICRLFCCDWLKNVQGATKETDCSTNCTRAAFTIGMSAKRQVQQLKRMGCEREAPLKFNAFEDCLLKKSALEEDTDDDDDDDSKAADSLLREVCRGENGEK